MDEITLERYPHGVPWKEMPGYHTERMLRRHRDLVEAIRRYGAEWPQPLESGARTRPR